MPWPHISVCKWIPSQLLSVIFYSKCLREGLPLKTVGTRNTPGPYFGSVNGKERWAAPRFPSPFGGGSSWQGPPLPFCFILILYFNTAKHSHWQPSPGWGIAIPILIMGLTSLKFLLQITQWFLPSFWVKFGLVVKQFKSLSKSLWSCRFIFSQKSQEMSRTSCWIWASG